MPYARKDTLIWQKGMYYHIYNRGARQVTIFREPTNYHFTISKMREYSRAQGISVIAYCLMPNHYHFLVRQDGEEAAGNLPRFVFNSYSKAFNKMYGRSGTLFEGRYRAKVIQSRSHLLHLCRYIHGNPVKDGMAAGPGEWPYSNYLEWLGQRSDFPVDRDFIREHFSDSEKYGEFLAQYLNARRLPDTLTKQIGEMEK